MTLLFCQYVRINDYSWDNFLEFQNPVHRAVRWCLIKLNQHRVWFTVVSYILPTTCSLYCRVHSHFTVLLIHLSLDIRSIWLLPARGKFGCKWKCEGISYSLDASWHRCRLILIEDYFITPKQRREQWSRKTTQEQRFGGKPEKPMLWM